MYHLEGIADKPNVVKKIEKETTNRTYYTELLDIDNWLPCPQQFKVVTINIKPNEKNKILYKLTGNEIIDVPATGQRQYKWCIYVLNVGTLNFQVKSVFLFC